jgi:Fur family transcriptional regulator, peroxide stress response regulator
MGIIPTKKDAPVVTARRARGLRLTAPRRLILEVVRTTDAHPTAAYVYARVRRRLPRVSLATVYRNLRRLAAEGVLLERADTTGMRFDANLDRHDHFTCLTCRRIYDVTAPARRRAPSGAAARAGFEVLEQRTEFYGRCAACRRRGALIAGRRSTGERANGSVVSTTAHRRTFHGRT